MTVRSLLYSLFYRENISIYCLIYVCNRLSHCFEHFARSQRTLNQFIFVLYRLYNIESESGYHCKVDFFHHFFSSFFSASTTLNHYHQYWKLRLCIHFFRKGSNQYLFLSKEFRIGDSCHFFWHEKCSFQILSVNHATNRFRILNHLTSQKSSQWLFLSLVWKVGWSRKRYLRLK